jgi:hypothetical protein
MWHYSMYCPIFLSWYCFHYTYWSLDTHISLIWSPILEIFSGVNHIILFTCITWVSTWRKKSCLQTLRRFYGITSFSRYPLVEIFIWKSRWPLFLIRPWTLNLDYTTFPFLYFGMLWAYPPNFYWISKHWQISRLSTKKAFSSPLIVIILQFVWSLWLKNFYKLLG